MIWHPYSHAADLHKTEKLDVNVEKVLDGLENPWGIAFISSTDWLVTERPGRLRRVIDGQLLAEPIAGLPSIAANGQGGLLDVIVHPNFKENQWLYLSYSAGNLFGIGTEVLRAKLSGNNLTDVQTIFVAKPKQRGSRHFGSRLVFDEAGYLFISLGDRGDRDSAQDVSEHAGSIIRLNDDGSVPAENPFIGKSGIKPEIFSSGHRNVQGMVFDREKSILWAHEHGPQGGDELNRVEAGLNYGWPTITYGENYGIGTAIGEGTSKDGLEQPVHFWDPSIAPSGMAVVTGDQYPGWENNLLVGALKFQLIARLEVEDGQVVHEERLFAGDYGRIRDVKMGLDNSLYFLTDSPNGAIYRITK